MSTGKEKYSRLIEQEKSIPLFSRDWWLDAVCGPENWDVILVEKGGQISAALPYFTQSMSGFKLITMPPLTQTMMLWIKYQSNMDSEQVRTKYEKELINNIIDQLPRFDYYKQNFHHSFTNWLPFHWKGFEQTTRYTYLIEDLGDIDELFRKLKGSVRTDVKKAEKEFSLVESEDVDKFYRLNEMIFSKAGKKMSYNYDMVKRLDTAAAKAGKRKIMFAENDNGEACAGIYIVWDEECVYYIMSGSNPKFGNTGAPSMLIWEAIKFASTFAKYFDFEGSMMEPLEKFFRSFGAVQKPYFRITKVNSRILQLAFAAKGLLK
jgi:hypothetical protein